ncbi:MAG TPA: CBS domain-containing protein [Candidatus Dormibacteraeota bacterium]|nr:CBS domain-containing protein [Candidatus Dormibacteraeota bacterium]
MKARDVMTTDVASVAPDSTIHEVAMLLLDRGISAVPVVDALGAPIGMVSEGDLIDRHSSEREARRDWWLAMLAEGTALSPRFLDFIKTTARPVRQVMTAPVVTVSEDTPVAEIGQLLETHRIKRVPVLRGGRVVGIVSRADVLRALAATLK